MKTSVIILNIPIIIIILCNSCQYEKDNVIKSATENELLVLMNTEKFDNRDNEKAIEVGQYAVEKYQSYKASAEIGDIMLHRKKDPEKAIEYYILSLELGGDSVDILNRMGRAHYINKNYENARDCYIYVLENYHKRRDEAVPMDNTTFIKNEYYGAAQCYLARTCHFLGDNEMALTYYNRAIAYNDSAYGTSFAFAYYGRANTHFLLGDTLAAIKDYNIAAEDLPDRMSVVSTTEINEDNIGIFKFGTEEYYDKIQ